MRVESFRCSQTSDSFYKSPELVRQRQSDSDSQYADKTRTRFRQIMAILRYHRRWSAGLEKQFNLTLTSAIILAMPLQNRYRLGFHHGNSDGLRACLGSLLSFLLSTDSSLTFTLSLHILVLGEIPSSATLAVEVGSTKPVLLISFLRLVRFRFPARLKL